MHPFDGAACGVSQDSKFQRALPSARVKPTAGPEETAVARFAFGQLARGGAVCRIPRQAPGLVAEAPGQRRLLPAPAHPPPWRAPCRTPAHDSGWAVSVKRGPGGSLPGQREGRPLSGAGRTGRRPGRRCLPTQAGREAACWRLAARTGPHPAPASSPDLSPGPQNSGQLSSARPQGSAGRSLAPRCAWRLCPAGSSGARPPCVGDISESRDSSGCPRKEPYGVLSARRPGVRNAVLPATARHPRSSCTRPGPASGLGLRGRMGGSRRRVCRSGTLPAPPQPAPGRLPRRPPVSPGLGRTRAPSSPPAPSAPTSWLCGPLC